MSVREVREHGAFVGESPGDAPAVEAAPADRIVPAPRLSRAARFRQFLAPGALLLVLLALVIPVFQSNALGTAEPDQFNGWDAFSESLVLGKIESTLPVARAPGIARFGLLAAQPEITSPSHTFDRMPFGAVPEATEYLPYDAQLGLPGFLFTGLYHLGLRSGAALQQVGAIAIVLTLTLFTVLLARATRKSFAAAFAVAAIGSPWLVSAGHNLYWIPWTWFLPACAALWYGAARTRRRRTFALVLLASAFLVRWASGFEFITSLTLLAATMPVLAQVLGRSTRTWRAVLRDVGVIGGVAVLAFALVAVVQALVTGNGDLQRGFGLIVFNILKRTVGGVATTDPQLLASFQADPLTVLGIYLFGWRTNVLALGSGSSFQLVLGPQGLWLLLMAVAAVITVRLLQKDVRWRRDMAVVGVALLVPLAWIVPAKGHAIVHQHIDYVLFSLITLGALSWIVLAWLMPTVKDLGLRAGVAVLRASGRTS